MNVETPLCLDLQRHHASNTVVDSGGDCVTVPVAPIFSQVLKLCHYESSLAGRRIMTNQERTNLISLWMKIIRQRESW